MRIAVDGRNTLARMSGLGRYLLEICGALSMRGHEIIYLLPGKPAQGLNLTPGARIETATMPGALGRLLWSVTILPNQIKRLRPDVFWGPAHRLPPGLPTALPRVVTVHDLVWRHAPQTMRLKGWLAERLLMGPSIANADIVCTSSETSAADIGSHYPAARGKIRVVPPPIASFADMGALSDPPVDRPYILFVGTLEPRKNVANLIAAFARLPADLRKANRLVICGGKGWRSEDPRVLAELVGVADRVTILGHASDAELAALYANARCLALPSFHEGFGLPIVEAHRFAVPVLTSNRSSMPEVAGEGALLADPDNSGSIAVGLERLLRDDALHDALSIAAAANAARYSIDRSADAMEEALLQAVHVRRSRR